MQLTWGIIGTGKIAQVFARGLAASKTGRLVAVGSRSQDSAAAFGKVFGIDRCHASYQALLDDAAVQAVYIATPHPMHARWAIRAAEAGKHILCEKPLTLNHAEAMAVIEAAHRNDVFLMEAFMYRCHPQTQKVIELVRAGVIGDVRVIQATFSFHTPFDLTSRLLNNELGGGGILDVGCYCASMARLIAGIASGQACAEPIEVRGSAYIGPLSRVDEYAVAALKFPGGILAQLAAGVQVGQECVVRIFGREGTIIVPNPWVPGARERIIVNRHDNGSQEIAVNNDTDLYALEADTVAAHLAARQAPAMTWDDTLGNMRTLDRWRQSIGLVYDSEQPAAQRLPVHGRPLAVRSPNLMQYGQIPGVDRPVSRLIMGTGSEMTMPHMAVMFDDFFERGGTCFDTAYIYADGAAERMLGQWIRNRGVRDQVVILDKGGHTPFCTPEHVDRQIRESLERLQTDYIDLYMLHRDNLRVAVGEFIDLLNEHQRTGRIHSFGASNWSIARIEAANAYARARGLNGFVAISNNFSLARMIEPVWDGCLSAADAESRAWFTKTQMPLLAWSSQARGFFAGRAHPGDRSDPELARAWYSDDNFQRLARATALAQRRGVLPINIALAYVLCQPFPTFALIGPQTLAETRTAFPALTIELSPDERRWLNLEL